MSTYLGHYTILLYGLTLYSCLFTTYKMYMYLIKCCVHIHGTHTLRCLHSLSRSTKLLRTNLADHNVWKPCLSMLSLRDEECLVTATGVACNLLLEFSPSREVGL